MAKKKAAKKKAARNLGPPLPLWADAEGKAFRPSMEEGLVELPGMSIHGFSLYYDLEERLRLPDGKVFFYVRRQPGAPAGAFNYDPFNDGNG